MGGGVEARLEIDGAAEVQDELSSLRRWLGDEAEFRGRVRVERAAVGPGEMGGLIDALSVSLASGGALTVLAGSVSVWLRQKRSTLTVRIVNADGSSQEISARGPAADTLAKKIDPRRHD
jgi:hypothetical protein